MRWTCNDDVWFRAIDRAVSQARASALPNHLGAGLLYHVAFTAVTGSCTALAIAKYDRRRPGGMVQDNGAWRPITDTEALHLSNAMSLYWIDGIPLKRFQRRYPEFTTKGGRP